MKRTGSLLLALVLLLTLFAPAAFAQETDPVQTQVTVLEDVSLMEDLPTNDELFAGYVDQAFFGKIQTFGTNGRARLNAQEKQVYDILKQRIEHVAAYGGSTVITIELDDVDGLQKFFPAGTDIFEEFDRQLSFDKLFSALVFDCPYELYWFDKGTGGMGMGYTYSEGRGGVTLVELQYYFSVAQNYRYRGNEYFVADDVGRVRQAVDNAKNIVRTNRTKNEYEKLVAYRDEICRRVSYNYAAAENMYSYGANNDPWQLVYVFDNNPSTNVVCEGYAKAFQYLCDLSNLEDTVCYTVTGYMNGGSHMWNVVAMEDGKNYIADITNSDADTVGADGSLFLAGTNGGSVTAGYWFGGVIFRYDIDTLALYSEEELKLSTTDYTPSVSRHKFTNYKYNNDAKCGVDGTETAKCDRGCGAKDTRTAEGTALSHTFTEYVSNNDAKCGVDGTKTAVCDHGCGEEKTVADTGSALTHKFTNYKFNNDAAPGVDGTETASCAHGCGAKDTRTAVGTALPAVPTTPTVTGAARLYGNSRYETSFGIANEYKSVLGADKFDSVIIASGVNFPDALAGSYLAATRNAPILMAKVANGQLQNADQLKTYIDENLVSGGQVYVLGGQSAIPYTLEDALTGLSVKRLQGNSRYDTNLLILNEAGITGDTLLVCTGKGYADALSASASGLPIMLVDGEGTLKDAQKDFLRQHSFSKIFILGGTSAVNAGFDAALDGYANTVKRLSGANRRATSVLVAETFFDNPDTAIIAYSKNFPDGLCGGPLANVLGAPILLTETAAPTEAINYARAVGIKAGYALGGNSLVSDDVVKGIIGTDSVR